MKKTIRYVGLDVHQKSIAVAVAESGAEAAKNLAMIPNERTAIRRCLERLGPAGSLRVCYEAGPTGYGLARWLRAEGIDCQVVAPSLVARPEVAAR